LRAHFFGATALYFPGISFLEIFQFTYYVGQGTLYLLLFGMGLILIARKKPAEFRAILSPVAAVAWSGFLLFVATDLNSKILENEAARREVREITQAARSIIETQEALVETSVV
jgi:hypothetical protein